MSTPAVIAPPALAAPRRSVGHPAAIVAGCLIAIVGALLAIGGGAIFAVFGTDGALSTGRQPVATTTSALVSGVATISDTAGVTDVLGATRLTVDAGAEGSRGVFVGVGPKADVDRYLAGAAVDEVTDFDVDPFTLDRTTRPGSAIPAPPADQPFWVTQSSGRASADISWKVADGDYRVVVMNADGTPDVITRTRFGVTVARLPAIGVGIVIGGGLLLAGGVLLIVLGARRRAS